MGAMRIHEGHSTGLSDGEGISSSLKRYIPSTLFEFCASESDCDSLGMFLFALLVSNGFHNARLTK